MLGATGAVVSMVTAMALEAALTLPAASVAVAVRLWAPLARRGGVAPGAAAVGGGAAEQRGAVIDLDRAVGFRRAGQRQRVGIGDAVADHAAVGRERGDGRRNRRRGVDGHASAREAALTLPAASVAVAVRLWAPLASAAGGIGPGAAAVGGGAAEQGGAVIDLDRALASAVPVSVSVLALVMRSPTDAAVGRERGDASAQPARWCRWSRPWRSRPR